MGDPIVTLVRGLHLLLIIGVSVAPFVPDYTFKKWAWILLVFIFFHHITNHHKCGLTQLEGWLLGEKKTEGFLYRVIHPVMTVHETQFYKQVHVFHILWLLILT